MIGRSDGGGGGPSIHQSIIKKNAENRHCEVKGQVAFLAYEQKKIKTPLTNNKIIINHRTERMRSVKKYIHEYSFNKKKEREV